MNIVCPLVKQKESVIGLEGKLSAKKLLTRLENMASLAERWYRFQLCNVTCFLGVRRCGENSLSQSSSTKSYCTDVTHAIL